MRRELREQLTTTDHTHDLFIMIDLARISLAALLLVMVSSCTTEVNPGFISLASAWVIGMYLAPLWGRSFTIGEIMAGLSDRPLPDAGRRHAVVYAGAGQRHARSGGPDRAARMQGEHRADSDRVFRAFVVRCVDRGGQHRGRRTDRTPGDGRCRTGADSPVLDDHHGGAWLRCRGALADRPDAGSSRAT